MKMHKIFDVVTEIVGWIQIFLSPALFGIGIGYGIYYYYQNTIAMILGILIAIIGFTLGVFWATKMFKTTGTIVFLSNVIATPELDKLKKSKSEKNNIEK